MTQPTNINITCGYTPSRFIKIPRARYVEIRDAVGEDTLLYWASKICTLENLAWQYIDTILDILVQMKLKVVRPVTCRIREIKTEYDRFRARCIDKSHVLKESNLAENFNDYLGEDLGRLFYALDFEVSRMDIIREQRPLLIAVYQAITILEALRIYARQIDDEIRHDYHIMVKDCSLIQACFLELYTLIPQYAGDCWKPNLDAVRITANVIARKIEEAEIRII